MVLGLALGATACGPRSEAAERRLEPGTPVFLIVIDTLRADHLGCYGYERDTSPCLDAFAAGATLFENATTQANSTFPSLTSILTGLYLKTHRNYLAVPIEGWMPASEGAQPLSERFAARGYARVAVLSHPVWSRSARPLIARGWSELSQIDPSLSPEERVARTRGSDTNRRAFELLERYGRPGAEPLFFWLHYFEPHTDKWPNVYDANPLTRDLYLASHLAAFGLERHEPTLRSLEPEQRLDWIRAALPEEEANAVALANGRALYDAEIRSCDAALGAFFERLREQGLFDRALIAVLADHGENMEAQGSAEEPQGRGPLAFSHERLFDGVARTPFLLKLPQQTQGQRLGALVQNIDLAPTLIELLGLPAEVAVEGQSLVPLLSGERDSLHDFVYIESTDYVEKAVRGPHLKWIDRGEEEPPLVFDWQEDRDESRDLYNSLPAEQLEPSRRALRDFQPIDSLGVHIEGDGDAFAVELELRLSHSPIERVVGADEGCLLEEGRRFLWSGRVPPQGLDLSLFPRRRNTTMDWRVRTTNASSSEPLQRRVFLGNQPLDRTAAIPRWRPGAGPLPEHPRLSIRDEAEAGRLLVKCWPRGEQHLVLEARYERPDYSRRIFPLLLEGFGELELTRDRAWKTEAFGARPATAVLGRSADAQPVYLLTRVDGAWPLPAQVVVDGRPARADELEFSFPHPLDGRITSALRSAARERPAPGSITIRLETGGGAGRIDSSGLDPALAHQLEVLGYVR